MSGSGGEAGSCSVFIGDEEGGVMGGAVVVLKPGGSTARFATAQGNLLKSITIYPFLLKLIIPLAS